ncbi:2Fe-2S iron-sulfur cluster-binding protein [Streptomyces hesseae]|uniref:2Fe-2S iron-sulfur cluster-binding protein n=1 Tax=Streptomyces hesseae TaxID=3075519 RepID=A0ABU2SRK4_9ACTN|nr:2Fe-2S iron-sulfur cluster-binding protein [Streptomyces sp. DSM 40473]MDT0450539.1 2Fe-2S iron-sulfur cluster-binding protein [Streptomyces sp. DSM 40473]
MSDDQQRHTHAPAPGAGGWQPIPQGAGLEADGTTFLQLPPELLAQTGPGTGAGWSPLAAPGTGYAPPVVDSWQQPQHQHPQHLQHQHPEAAPAPAPVQQHVPQVPAQQHWDSYEQRAAGSYDHHQPAAASYDQHVPDAHALVPEQHVPDQHVPDQHVPGADDGGAADPHATAQWQVSFAADDTGSGAAVPGVAAVAEPEGPEPLNHPGPGATGQWSVPAAGDDSVEESGEYALRDSAARQWSVPAARDASAGYGTGVADVAVDDRTVTDAGDNPTGEWTAAAEPAVTGEATETVEAEIEAEAKAEDLVSAEGAHDAEAQPAQEPETDRTDGHDRAEPEAQGQGQVQGQDDLPAPDHPQPYALNEHPCASYVLRVNGTDRPVTDAWIGESLLYVLRERLGLAGAKDGCSQGECGACSVQVDGRLVASCLVPAATSAGAEIRTVEGLAAHGQPSDVQRALAQCGAVQCGFCVPGLAMTVHDLLEGNHAPTELETRQAICGNLCRCSGYRGVLEAVRQVADERAEAAALEEEAAAEADAATHEEQARIEAQALQAPDPMGIPHQQPGPYGDGAYAQGPYGTGAYDDGSYDTGSYGGGPYGDGGSYGDGPYGDGGAGSGFGKATA